MYLIDIGMPLTLFAVTLVSMFLNPKVEPKLKGTLEERKLGVWDAALLVGMMSVMIFLIVFVQQISLVLMTMFLFAYSLLLFTFTYLFSKNRWYIAIIPPAAFVLLYVFFRFFEESVIWNLYLVDVYGLVFAVLITLYLVTLFTWKTTTVFGVLITVMDIVLVWGTGTMFQAAEATRSLNLPVMVSIPLIPVIISDAGVVAMTRLGLGDFFFAGLLGIQTFKRYGRRFAVLSVVAMTMSFFLFEVLMLVYLQVPFPGTLMIICGWAPLVLWKEYKKRSPKEVGDLVVKQETGTSQQ